MPTLIPQYQNSYSYSANSNYPTPTVPWYIEPLATTTGPTYRSPPASAPISEEQLDNERKYATNQVVYHSESRPVTLPDSAYGDQALSQLEDELAAEKYKYNLQKAAEEKQRKEKQKQQSSQVAKLSGYIELLSTTIDSTYRGPPASVPISEEQLDNERKYATSRVAYHSESRPVTLPDSAYGDQLSQLEDELAAEKYKYNLQKAAEEKQKKEKQKQGRIRVFEIKPHKSAPKLNTGMVEWQSSQVAKCEFISNFDGSDSWETVNLKFWGT
ncbi:hypothetical protein CAEBREN_20921 [Caenorhabditis brenneri]|uniref:Uncharacterized protein n=1 Tax=Caenorhabditis brenneri TaxID=135651 RepID=G0N6C8_CAEBE|nr:hypothetical protein CAEBREN_20921 [Caenorhabditis brenneri]